MLSRTLAAAKHIALLMGGPPTANKTKMNLLGRWETNVSEVTVERRILLANLDCCSCKEVCSDPQVLQKLGYFIERI